MEGRDLRYGWWKWRPKAIQWFNKPVWFQVCLCYARGIMSFVKDGLLGVSLSTIERRFGLSSSQSSFIMTAFEIGSTPMQILVSIVGARAHRPSWITCCTLLQSVAFIVFTLPHFFTGLYEPGGLIEGDTNLCGKRLNDTSTVCRKADDSSRVPIFDFLFLFIIARVMMGAADTAIGDMSTTFMDDSVGRETLSVYSGIQSAVLVMFPAIGYIGGSELLRLYTDFDAIDPAKYGLNSSDPRWVGAWWPGFFLGGIALLLIIFPLGGFARDLPGSKSIRDFKLSEAHGTFDDTKTEKDLHKFRDLPKSLAILFKNPPFIIDIFANAANGIIVGGLTSFGPKYIENQFSMEPAFAGMVFGVLTLPPGVIGTIIGGYIVKWRKLSANGIYRALTIINALVILLIPMYLITCQEVQFVGVNVGSGNSTMVTNLTASCYSGCDCADVPYSPICSADNKRYFSPCHAGCAELVENETHTSYFNCSCISSVSPISGESATSKNCSVSSCKLAPLFFVLLFLGIFLTYLEKGVGSTKTVRIVPTAQKSLAIGFSGIMYGVLSLPGPILFGAAFDNACTLWDKRCHTRGSCLAYDNRRLSLNVFLLCAGMKVLNVVLVFAVWKLYKPPVHAEKPDAVYPDANENHATANLQMNDEEDDMESDAALIKESHAMLQNVETNLSEAFPNKI